MVTVTPTGGPLGAYVTGVDLALPPDPDTTAAIRGAWLDHLVLVFPDQNLDPDQYLRFARSLGEPAEYPFVDGLDGYPLITEVLKLPGETVNFGGIWHSDTAYLDEPPMASMLVAREVPPVGGDTEFANGYLAWDTLDPDLRDLLDGRVARNSSAAAMSIRNTADRMTDDQVAQVFEAEHPAVRTHPETARKCLFVNAAHTYGLVGVDDEVAGAALKRVFAHQVRPELVWRLKWRPGTLALWDNRCCLHNPINDYHGHTRRMHRITLAGDRPR